MKNGNDNISREDLFTFDDAFPDGVFVIPQPDGYPRIRIRALIDYCDLKGVLPVDLTSEEFEMFLIREKD